MSDLVPTSRRNELVPTVGVGITARVARDWRAARALAQVERQTLVRIASVQGHAAVQAEKMHEIDQLTREAMTGQAMLQQWAATLAQGDAFLADDLKFYTDMAKVGKGSIIADTVSDFTREGRR